MNQPANRISAPAPKKRVLNDFFVVSADSHVHEPHDLWSKRIDKKFRDRVPRIEVDDKGRKWFVVEGFRKSIIRETPRDEQISLSKFKPVSMEGEQKKRELDPTKGGLHQVPGSASVERYGDMDHDGVDAEVVFPNKGLTNWSSPDSEFQTALCRISNDWAHEVFGESTRTYPVACVAPSDVVACVKEIHRIASMGFHAVMMPPILQGGYNRPELDQIWGALTETRLPVCFHAGTGKDPRTAAGNGGAIINYVVHAMNTVLEPVVQLCSSGVFDRYPTLNFATIEAGAGWVPFALWAMDHGHEKHAFWVSPQLKERPSEYFRRHGHASFQDDPIAVETRKWMGVDTIMWGNDYPHLEGTWPNSEEVAGRIAAETSREEFAKIVGLNAARLFNIDVPANRRLNVAQQNG